VNNCAPEELSRRRQAELQIMAHQPPISPDSRKKKPALPFLLSNLRNAQAAITGSVAGSSEARPLVGGNTSSTNERGYANRTEDRSNMKRSVTASARSSSALDSTPSTRLNNTPNKLSSTLISLQQRFENTWRKRNQHLHKEDDSLRHNTKRRRQIRVSIPQSFLFSSVCFFIGIPLLVLMYVLAKKSVFGDEGVEISDHKYEVKTFDMNPSGDEHESVLAELESQFKDVKEDNVDADFLNSVGDESALGPVIDSLNSNGDTNQSTEDETRDGEHNIIELQKSNVSEQVNGNLRGYQSSEDGDQEVKSITGSNEIVDQSDPKIDSQGNMALESENETDDNDNAESAQETILEDKGS
jgi:hypothetical protein